SIPPSSLAKAQAVVLGIRHDYSCQQAVAAVATWQENKPKPHKVRKKVHGKIQVRTVTPPYNVPKPTIPTYCPGQQGGSG
ncbi:MAG: hypothetical protein ABJB47_03190, partial [Actinomycetota bacterium]